MERKFTWDGEKIKEVQIMEDKKHSPKDIINGLDNIRNQINQFENTEIQLKQQSTANKQQLKSAKEFEKELREFEDKCIEIQKNKLELYINQFHVEFKKKAMEDAIKIVEKTPDAYNDDLEKSKKNVAYLNYQKMLGTNEKVAENIAKSIITKFLYEEPIFENPFKD